MITSSSLCNTTNQEVGFASVPKVFPGWSHKDSGPSAPAWLTSIFQSFEDELEATIFPVGLISPRFMAFLPLLQSPRTTPLPIFPCPCASLSPTPSPRTHTDGLPLTTPFLWGVRAGSHHTGIHVPHLQLQQWLYLIWCIWRNKTQKSIDLSVEQNAAWLLWCMLNFNGI